MKRNSSIAIGLIGILIGFLACHRSQKDTVPPIMKAASANFDFSPQPDTFRANYHNGRNPIISPQIITFAIDSKFFPVDNLYHTVAIPHITYFNAKFNEEVRWQIDIKGLSSNATKAISGLSSFLDSSNTFWNGNADSEALFTDGEKATATLSIFGSDKYKTLNLLIHKARTYDTTQAILLNDFEGSLGNPIIFGDKSDPIYYPAPHITSAIKPSVQGKNAMVMAGTDNNGDYFIGGFQVILDETADTLVLVKHSPEDIYINAYVYGYGPEAGLTPKATTVEFGISEDDNGDGSYDGATEDTFVGDIPITHVGWKLMYFRYSNLIRSVSRANGGSGNNIQEPAKAHSVNFNLLSQPNGSKVAAAVDYVIITFGKPFQP